MGYHFLPYALSTADIADCLSIVSCAAVLGASTMMTGIGAGGITGVAAGSIGVAAGGATGGAGGAMFCTGADVGMFDTGSFVRGAVIGSCTIGGVSAILIDGGSFLLNVT